MTVWVFESPVVRGPGNLLGVTVSPDIRAVKDSESSAHSDCSGVLNLPVGFVELLKTFDIFTVLLVEHHADGTASLARLLVLLVGSSVELVSQGWLGFLLEPLVFGGCSTNGTPGFAILFPVSVGEGVRVGNVPDRNVRGGAVTFLISSSASKTIELTCLSGRGPLCVVLEDYSTVQVLAGDFVLPLCPEPDRDLLSAWILNPALSKRTV